MAAGRREHMAHAECLQRPGARACSAPSSHPAPVSGRQARRPYAPVMAETISFARGAPSLDIVDVEGLREAAQQAFGDDPAGTVAYGTSVGYVPLREWIAEQHGVAVEQVLVTNGSMQDKKLLFYIC